MRGAMLAIGLALATSPLHAQPPASARVEIPIHDRTLSNGVHRYGFPLTIGGTELLAGLDTGAAGLRLLPDAVRAVDVEAGEKADEYGFSTGTRLLGKRGTAQIKIGSLSGKVSLQQVTSTACIPALPRCPGSLGLAQYGFLGSGLPGQGFRAQVGANMGPSSLDNPLMAVGARRWIIELPRPGETAPGRLILNPTDAEIAGFVMASLIGGFAEPGGGGMHDAVGGCLRNEATGARVCGPTAMDTGAFNVRVLNGRLGPRPWPEGTPMTLAFNNAQRQPVASMKMVVGRLGETLGYGEAPRREAMIQPGTAPYFAYAVLYDPGGRRLGFKARPPVPR